MGIVVYPEMPQWDVMLSGISSSDLVIVDLETSGLNPFKDKIAGAAVRVDGQSYYVPSKHDGLVNRNVAAEPWEEFCRSLHGVKIVNHNVKFDIEFLICQEGVRPLIRSDTMLLAHFINADQDLGLKSLSKIWIQTEGRKTLKEVTGGTKNACRTPIHKICEYAYDDVEEVEILFNKWAPLWESHFLHTLEVAILEDLIDAELRGVCIDLDKLDRLEKELRVEMEEKRQAALGVLGNDVNLDSPSQVSRAFLGLGVQLLQTTDTGGVTVNKNALQGVEGPGVQEYLKYKEVSKIVSTYTKGLRDLAIGGVIHTSFKPFHACTGRMSGSRPNLQNQPKKGPVRSCFVPRDGYYFAECDLAQVELRIFASEANATVWIEAFNQGLDLHRVIAGLMFSKPWETVTDDERYKAKAFNFGIIYGMGKFGLAKRLDVSVEEASMLLDRYFSTDPAIKRYIDSKIEEAKVNGYVRTKFGRVRLIPSEGIFSSDRKTRAFWEHTAVNSPIQGTAADINKICFHRVKQYGARYGFYPLITVHDSVLTEVPMSLAPADHEAVMREAMIFPIDGYVTMDVDYVYGDNWADLKSAKEHEISSDFSSVRECNACIVRREATAPVPPQQANGANIMVVGRNPGAQEDKQGYPFVHEAPSGNLLNYMLGVLGVDRSKIHLTNVVKCYTAMNRAPSPFECEYCAEKWLRKEIEAVKPRAIITLGNEASGVVTRNPHVRITRDMGKVFEVDGRAVILLPHPSFMLRSSAVQEKVFNEILPAVRQKLFEIGVV